MQRKIFIAVIIFIIVVVFTSLIANVSAFATIFDGENNVTISRLIAQTDKVVFYSIKLIFFFFALVFTYKKFKLPLLFIFICFSVPVLLIDLTVFIDGKRLIPLRFPFEILFPFLGLAAGFVYLKRRKYFPALAFLLILFIYASNRFFIPSMIRYMEKRDSHEIVAASPFDINPFYTIADIPVRLSDTARKKCLLVDYYFVGCQPCENKMKFIKVLQEKINPAELNIILICDGSITDFPSFYSHAQKNAASGFTFLYDKDGELRKRISGIGYPYELILDESRNIISSQVGFNNETSTIYVSDDLKTIQAALHQ